MMIEMQTGKDGGVFLSTSAKETRPVSVNSQLLPLADAEGLVNYFLGDRFQAVSGGTEATRVNPLAARVLLELGIDIDHHRLVRISTL